MVPVSMPPITPVPMARWLAEPAPLARASGNTPMVKASDVMTMGLNRRWAASSAATTTLLPSA